MFEIFKSPVFRQYAVVVMAFSVVFFVDVIGRKYTLLLFACFPKIILCLLYIFANKFWLLLMGRALSGMVDSIVLIIVPMYASEVASVEIRGSLGTILQIFSSIGILIMLSFGPFLSYLSLNVMYTCITIAATIPILFLPQSPYFLYSRGRTAESTKVLTFLRGSEELAIEELKDYSTTTDDQGDTVNKLKLFKDRIFLKALGIVFVIAAGNNFIGYNAVTFYLQTVLQSTGTSISPEVSSVVIGCIQLTASICTALITDRFGRKPILSVTLIGMAFGMVGLGIFFKLKENSDDITGFLNVVPLASFIIIVFAFSAGPGSLSWILVAELFDGPARGVGATINIFIATATVFITTKYFPALIAAIGPALTYWIFSINCVLLSLFILYFVPETKGKSFKEIQIALGARYVNDMNANLQQKQ
ncbi:facilitated trehalose transporter Tret1-like isoform X2 [Hyposmocoma kahamanoa]|uniref:facilitated trehalose transporter Tret1-like isoform X2 n=1 Tax=Hyposmocoma kahamanoa TaxID=1477025 RepID=UPI000E6D6D2F|nr:facilitated trehalose transporter Tret1-like isoform X2 [Hyposmocoma kahamanoa]